MAMNDALIWKFEIDETRFNHSKSSIIFKVTYSSHKQNRPESHETITVWKKYRDLERLYNDLEKLRLALYLKEALPPFTEIKANKKQLNQDEIEEIRQSTLSLLEHIGRNACYYRNRIFTRFFEESELKVDKQVRSREDTIKNGNPTISATISPNKQNRPTYEQIIDSVNHVPPPNDFPIPFQQLVQDNQNQTKLDKKFKPTASTSKSDQENANDDCYLIDACHLICQAQLNEEKQEYESAFESYKCAISILLRGVKDERDRTKKLNVRKKVEKYLSKAEEIYDQHLLKEERSGSRKFSLDTPYKQMMNDEMCTEKNVLSKYKLLSTANKVQIVYDLKLNEKFAIKVVHKIPNLSSPKRLFLFPKIPNMVQLYQIYENDYAYFLVLEYFNCKKLSEIIDTVRQRLTPCIQCLFDPSEQLNQADDNEPDLDDDIDDLEEILFDKEKFNEDEEEYYLNRSDSVKTLSEIEDDLLNYQSKSRLVSSKSEQKLSSLAHSKSTDFGRSSTDGQATIRGEKANSTKSTFNTLTGIFDRARSLIKNVDQTIRNTSIDQARLSVDNIDLQCNLNNYILERINDKLLFNVYYCDRHLNKQLNDCETDGKMLFTEEMIRRWLWQIMIALENLHDQDLIYINLNPSKILVSQDLQDACLAYKYSLDYKQIAIAENLDPFNLSQLIVSSFYSTYSSSSLEYSYYVAPELFIFGSEISSAVDYWSFGCLAYELLTNRPLCSFIPSINCKNLIQFPEFLSIEARDLIEKLLQINPSERLNSHSIKVHPFFKPL